MNDIIIYFTGAFEMLFDYAFLRWHGNIEFQMSFIAVVSLFCAITLIIAFSIVKHAFIAVFNAIRKQ